MAVSPPRRLRADARRNREDIRTAAVTVFRARGLTTPLDDVARAAGVSKGTIYHHFGGRQKLIDAVVEEIVADRIDQIIADIEELDSPLERFEAYLQRIWLLQYDEPAVNDVLLRAMPDSEPLTSLCERASQFAQRLLHEARAAGKIREDLTAQDLYALIWERGIIACACRDQSRTDYERRCGYTLRGLRR
ncbi:TetR/AcrR family transcriptional regulator [Nocardia sp. 2YAB30]|uniref:TetR/AcrR family transcriptional regulator n=1 Tax=unclassified Nocardia TaxID=2637762 RepID=UPI003F9BB38D